jgi:hypothetical protein
LLKISKNFPARTCGEVFYLLFCRFVRYCDNLAVIGAKGN